MSKPYQKGYLPVSDGHKLYYEVCGNPKGETCLFLHGGPGSGFTEHHKDVFKMSSQRVIFFDQRGSSRSKPFASLKNNTAFKSCEDINKLLDFLEVEDVVIYGGSWGTTLGLVYAIRFPNRVRGLVLRGVFLSRKQSYEHYMGGGLGRYAPELWKEFLKDVPKARQRNPASYYAERIQKGSAKERKKFAKAWAVFELRAAFLEPLDDDFVAEQIELYSYESLAKLETHFVNKKCFLPDNYILKNSKKISHIPLRIVHGRYDLLCPPSEAYDLAEQFDDVKLQFPIAGHIHDKIDRLVKREIASLCKNY